MLIEFSVENHRAIREKQTFLMVAGEDTERTRARRAIGTDFAYSPRVLKTACIVGPNGAGKSSLVDAMRIMGRLARTPRRRDDGDEFAVEPFVFHSKWSGKPSEFEVVFIQGDTLYQYGFSVTRSTVIDEWLFASDSGKANQRTVFTRTYNKKTRGYRWYIKGIKSEAQKSFWKSATKHSSLFLNLADEFNVTKDLEIARNWISRQFIIRQTLDDGFPTSKYRGTARRIRDDKWKREVLDFLRQSGISVEDIQVNDSEDVYSKRIISRSSVSFIRRNDLNQEIPLSIQKESTGTKDLFGLAHPILSALDNGSTLVVDELNMGLHPLALEGLVSMFHNPDINERNAQLIFTTHDVASIEHARVDYDQIWLMQKNDALAARLYPFSDFRTTGKRTFMNGYLQGLYGAIPRMSRVRQ